LIKDITIAAADMKWELTGFEEPERLSKE